MNEQLYIKYHEARLWAVRVLVDPIGQYAEHEFALFYAESDWDDPQAAWVNYPKREQAATWGAEPSETRAVLWEVYRNTHTQST